MCVCPGHIGVMHNAYKMHKSYIYIYIYVCVCVCGLRSILDLHYIVLQFVNLLDIIGMTNSYFIEKWRTSNLK